jgi:molybdopterin converting factor small subunit
MGMRTAMPEVAWPGRPLEEGGEIAIFPPVTAGSVT